jgi:hypothetical protein
MKRFILTTGILFIVITMLASCGDEQRGERLNDVSDDQEIKILQSWQGDFPVAQLNLLPEKQREQAVGYISDIKTFENIWNAFKADEEVSEIDFSANLVLFARNTQFYNHISIGKVNLTEGVAEVLAMETMSAMPIEDNVAFSLAVVPRQGITSIKTGEDTIAIN